MRHGWRSADGARVTDRPRADRRGLGQHPQPSERARHSHQVLGGLGGQLAGEAVQPGDAPLGVVAGVAGVRRSLAARLAVPARAPHGRRHDVAALEAVAARLDDAEELVAEEQALAARRGHAERALRDLAVRAAHAHLERAQEQLAGAGRGSATSTTSVVSARPGRGDEAEHGQAAVSPPSMTNAVPVTKAASSDAR